MQDFRKLLVWHRAHALALAVRRAAETFPPRGFASLKQQLTDAADSVAANIVEGAASDTNPEFARFLNIALKSAAETEYWLQLARDTGALHVVRWRALSTETVEIKRMISGLRRRVMEQIARDDATERERKKRR
jgi:four helix bundle protein